MWTKLTSNNDYNAWRQRCIQHAGGYVLQYLSLPQSRRAKMDINTFLAGCFPEMLFASKEIESIKRGLFVAVAANLQKDKNIIPEYLKLVNSGEPILSSLLLLEAKHGATMKLSYLIIPKLDLLSPNLLSPTNYSKQGLVNLLGFIRNFLALNLAHMFKIKGLQLLYRNSTQVAIMEIMQKEIMVNPLPIKKYSDKERHNSLILIINTLQRYFQKSLKVLDENSSDYKRILINPFPLPELFKLTFLTWLHCKFNRPANNISDYLITQSEKIIETYYKPGLAIEQKRELANILAFLVQTMPTLKALQDLDKKIKALPDQDLLVQYQLVKKSLELYVSAGL